MIYGSIGTKVQNSYDSYYLDIVRLFDFLFKAMVIVKILMPLSRYFDETYRPWYEKLFYKNLRSILVSFNIKVNFSISDSTVSHLVTFLPS